VEQLYRIARWIFGRDDFELVKSCSVRAACGLYVEKFRTGFFRNCARSQFGRFARPVSDSHDLSPCCATSFSVRPLSDLFPIRTTSFPSRVTSFRAARPLSDFFSLDDLFPSRTTSFRVVRPLSSFELFPFRSTFSDLCPTWSDLCLTSVRPQSDLV
jgi:hypothetical protein